MIIAGNSNVTCFKQQGLEVYSPDEQVLVYWVGAITIGHFFNGHPAGEKVRKLFSQEKGWRLLSIGTHDIFNLFYAAHQGRYQEALNSTLQMYSSVFSEFKGSGKFVWLVFPQQPLSNYGKLTSQDLFKITGQFNEQFEKWCAKEGILIVNPLHKILGSDGQPFERYLQLDGLHLNVDGTKIYLSEIEELTGVQLKIKLKSALFEPRSEPESFCSLILNNMDVPFTSDISSEDINTSLKNFINELLKQRGLQLDIDAQSELVDSGLLDSLNLVETYSFAADLLQMDIPFDVNLRDLNTIEKVSEFLLNKKKALTSPDAQSELSQEVFLVSLRGDFDDLTQRDKIIEADSRISKMNDRLFDSFRDNFIVAGEGLNCGYGIVLFWLALVVAERKDYSKALELLTYASNRRFPVPGPRIEFYREKWMGMMNQQKAVRESDLSSPIVEKPASAESEVSRNVINTQQVPIWEKKIEESVLTVKGGNMQAVCDKVILTNLPDDDNIELTIAEINKLCNSGRFDEAHNTVAQAIEKHPDSTELLNLQAVVKMHLGDNGGAKTILADIIKRWPEDYTAYNNLACIFWEKGDLDNAAGYFDKALEKSRLNKVVVRGYGEMLLAQRKYAKVKEICDKYLKNNPDDMDIRDLVTKAEGVLERIKKMSRAVEKKKDETD